MTGFIVNVFPFRNRVSSKEAFEGLELGEGKLSRPVLRGPGGRKAAWLLGDYDASGIRQHDSSPNGTSRDLGVESEAIFFGLSPLTALGRRTNEARQNVSRVKPTMSSLSSAGLFYSRSCALSKVGTVPLRSASACS